MKVLIPLVAIVTLTIGGIIAVQNYVQSELDELEKQSIKFDKRLVYYNNKQLEKGAILPYQLMLKEGEFYTLEHLEERSAPFP